MLPEDFAVRRGKTQVGRRAIFEELLVWPAPSDLRSPMQKIMDRAQVYSLLDRTGTTETFKP